MKPKLDTLFKIMKGNWISQKTTYYLKSNQICCNQFNYLLNNRQYADVINKSHDDEYYLQYYKNNIKQTDTYCCYQTDQYNLNKIQKNNNKSLYHYKYSIYKDKYLKIQYIKKNIEYTEYINAINQKFITSVALLKKSNKYIAISFSSNIKIKEIDCI